MSNSVTLIASIIDLYLIFMTIRILLTWFPNVNFYDPPLSWLAQITDPYLNIFRSIIPPLGGMDVSPILAFLLLKVVRDVLLRSTAGLGFG
jgi:YggT family protein